MANKRVKSFSAQKGICGYVASTSMPVILSEVYDDSTNVCSQN